MSNQSPSWIGIILILLVTALAGGLVLGFIGDRIGLSSGSTTTAIGAMVGVIGAILISRKLSAK
jgi:hypothetical protein